MTSAKDRIFRFFSQIPDHRLSRRKLHRVEEILLLTFCGMIVGCDSWEDLEIIWKN
ncbi:MAG: transposase family protein [Proteobacteria bacterium]|nr:transposase family protein [Pseudomonadota bacterium]